MVFSKNAESIIIYRKEKEREIFLCNGVVNGVPLHLYLSMHFYWRIDEREKGIKF